MFIACSHKVHTPDPEEFGNVLDCMPEWMMWIGDSTIALIYQSNFVDTADIQALKTRMTCLTSAFFDRNHSIIDVDDFHVKGKDVSAPRGKLCPLVSCTYWSIDPEDKVELELRVCCPCFHYKELLEHLVKFYTEKKEKKDAGTKTETT